MPGVLKNIDYRDPVVRYRGQKIVDNLKKLTSQSEVQLELAVDVYYSLYLPLPVLEELDRVSIASTDHYEVIKTALNDYEFRKLRYYTVADAFASVAIGTLFLFNFLEELKTEEERRGQLGAGKSSGRPQEQPKEEGEGEGNKSRDLRSSVKNALKKTTEYAETIKELQYFVQGYRAGVGHTLDLDEDVTTTLKLVKNTDIKNILKFLTRIPDIRSIMRKRKLVYQRGEIEGYSTGSDVERIAPTELAYPSIYLYTKIAENKLLIYNKVLYMSMGPIYVLLDKSGSMDGNKILWAKATALALFMRCRSERRPFYIRFFDSEPYKLMRVRVNAKPSEVLKVIEYIASIRNGGGTDISKSIITACNDVIKIRSRELSDLIIITDGEDRIAKSLVRKSLAYAKVRLVSVMIMGENSDLREVSYKYLKVTRLSEKEMLNVVEAGE
ncbi:MAG: VWA domain-containing protein [Ignisphaera sp.]|uniref:VWA domain-containing protein n=1 Tax=Ignisphaera aggregans TaxID=334771 RepID=A0A7C4JJD4_9CREN